MSDTPNLDIKATLDTSSVMQNAPPAAEALQGIATSERAIGEEAGNATEQSEKLTKAIQAQRAAMMQTVFQAHRLMEGFKDISEGGRLASQGFVDIEETVSRFLPPMAQVGLAIASAVGLMAMMATSHKYAGHAAKEHASDEKEAAEDIKKSWEEANDVLSRDLKEIGEGKFWDNQLATAKQLTQEIKDQGSAIKIVESAQDALRAATNKLALEELNLQEQRDLVGKSGEDESAIKAKYSSLRAENAAGSQQERDKIEVKRAQDEQDLLRRQGEAKQLELNATMADAQRSFDKFNSARDATAPIDSDYEEAKKRRDALQDQHDNVGKEGADGSTIKPLTPAQVVDLYSLTNGVVEELRQRQVANHGPEFTEVEKRFNEQRKVLEEQEGKDLKGKTPEQQDEISTRYGTTIAAIDESLRRIATYNAAAKESSEAGQAMAKAIAEHTVFQREQDAKITAAGIRVEASQTTAQGDNVAGQVSGAKDSNAVAAAATKIKRETRDNELDAKIDQVEAQLKNAGDADKRIFDAILAKLKDEQIRNKEADELAGMTGSEDWFTGANTKPLRQSVIDKSNAAVSGVDATAKKNEGAAEKHEESAEQKATRQQIEAAAGQIEATGNKQLIAAMKRVVDAFKGKTDEASQLAELAQLMELHVSQMTSYKAATDSHLKRIDNALKSNRTNFQN